MINNDPDLKETRNKLIEKFKIRSFPSTIFLKPCLRRYASTSYARGRRGCSVGGASPAFSLRELAPRDRLSPVATRPPNESDVLVAVRSLPGFYREVLCVTCGDKEPGARTCREGNRATPNL
ncbi:jg4692 [Pararge aegeria aegeria]|uniref:Jg4692 protein n=1 Tax=Pararge aegeria aegeria TaxID=348720 RepID=A0A8S4RGM9_9NEOP|nr:jg4692 [Pararge aegeria aegeria]